MYSKYHYENTLDISRNTSYFKLKLCRTRLKKILKNLNEIEAQILSFLCSSLTKTYKNTV